MPTINSWLTIFFLAGGSNSAKAK